MALIPDREIEERHRREKTDQERVRTRIEAYEGLGDRPNAARPETKKRSNQSSGSCSIFSAAQQWPSAFEDLRINIGGTQLIVTMLECRLAANLKPLKLIK